MRESWSVKEKRLHLLYTATKSRLNLNPILSHQPKKINFMAKLLLITIAIISFIASSRVLLINNKIHLKMNYKFSMKLESLSCYYLFI